MENMEQILINYTRTENGFTLIIKGETSIVKNEEGEKEQLFIEELKTIIKKYSE